MEKARETFPNSRITLSTLLQRKDFHPKTIDKINSSISRHCALLPNVHLTHHLDLDTDCLYDHIHLYKNLVHIFAKRIKDVALNRSNQTSRTSSNPTRHTSGNYIPANTSSRALAGAPPRASAPKPSAPRASAPRPSAPRPSAPRASAAGPSPPRGPHRASVPRADPYGQRLFYNSPTAPAAETRPQQSPAQPDRPSYAQAVSGGASRANAELHDLQHMLSIICSHLLTHSGQW